MLLGLDSQFKLMEHADKEMDKIMDGIMNEDATVNPHILDSGNRTRFESGAVRDNREGKGRCDLLPLDVISEYFAIVTEDRMDPILMRIGKFQNTGVARELFYAISEFSEQRWESDYTMILEEAKHFEEGAKKYGDNNWQKGIPVRSYIDSAVRHYLKFKRGDVDEPHDRAFCWNLLCAIWTCRHYPELNDYRPIDEKG